MMSWGNDVGEAGSREEVRVHKDTEDDADPNHLLYIAHWRIRDKSFRQSEVRYGLWGYLKVCFKQASLTRSKSCTPQAEDLYV